MFDHMALWDGAASTCLGLGTFTGTWCDSTGCHDVVDHPLTAWDGFAAWCDIDTHTAVVTGGVDHMGIPWMWLIDDVAFTAHFIGGTCGAFIFGDFMCSALVPVDGDWTFTYTFVGD